MVRDSNRTKEAATVVPIYSRFSPLRCNASPPRPPSSPSRGELRHQPLRATPRSDTRDARGRPNGGTVSQSAASRGRGGGVDGRVGARTRQPRGCACLYVHPAATRRWGVPPPAARGVISHPPSPPLPPHVSVGRDEGSAPPLPPHPAQSPLLSTSPHPSAAHSTPPHLPAPPGRPCRAVTREAPRPTTGAPSPLPAPVCVS